MTKDKSKSKSTLNATGEIVYWILFVTMGVLGGIFETFGDDLGEKTAIAIAALVVVIVIIGLLIALYKLVRYDVGPAKTKKRLKGFAIAVVVSMALGIVTHYTQALLDLTATS